MNSITKIIIAILVATISYFTYTSAVAEVAANTMARNDFDSMLNGMMVVDTAILAMLVLPSNVLKVIGYVVGTILLAGFLLKNFG